LICALVVVVSLVCCLANPSPSVATSKHAYTDKTAWKLAMRNHIPLFQLMGLDLLHVGSSLIVID
jgi:hypothetical protein